MADIASANAILSIRSVILSCVEPWCVLLPAQWNHKFGHELGSYSSFIKRYSPDIFIFEEDLVRGLLRVKLSPDLNESVFHSFNRIVGEGPELTLNPNIFCEEDPQYLALAGIKDSKERAALVGKKHLQRAREVVKSLSDRFPEGFPRGSYFKALGESGIPPIPVEWFDSIVISPGGYTVYRRSGADFDGEDRMEEPFKTFREALVKCGGTSVPLEFLRGCSETEPQKLTEQLKTCPFLLFEPEKVFPCQTFERMVYGYISPETANEQRRREVLASMSPLTHLINCVQAMIDVSAGQSLRTDYIVALCDALNVKPKLVWRCLKDRYFCSAEFSDSQILLRVNRHLSQSRDPLLSQELPTDLITEIKGAIQTLGGSCTVEKLACDVKWGKGSENRRKYGPLRTVITGIQEIFYEPKFMYSKTALSGEVNFPPPLEQDVTSLVLEGEEARYRSSSDIRTSVLYYLTDGGYDSYPLKVLDDALVAAGSLVSARQLRGLFVPGNNIFLRKELSELCVDPVTIGEFIHLALWSSRLKALDIDMLLKAVYDSGRFDRGEIEDCWESLRRDCREVKRGTKGELSYICFYNPDIVILDAVASVCLEIPEDQTIKPSLTHLGNGDSGKTPLQRTDLDL
jgi:hypothetical protein